MSRLAPRASRPVSSLAETQGVRALDRLLRAASVAVVGVSPNPSYVATILKNLLSHDYAGQVVAVNPNYDRVLETACYPSVLDVPGPLDLVIVGVPVRLVPAVLEQSEQKQVGALCIVTSGFAEMGGEEAVRREAELSEWSARTGIVVCGPNCWGLMNVPTGMVALPISFPNLMAGSVAAILQSGAMSLTVLAPLLARGIGVTTVVTTGNEAALEAADLIVDAVQDEQTHVIACFTEQIRTPERFIAACELAAEHRKPIVMLKIGRSEAGRRAALAHTGSLVGSDEVVDATLQKLGVTRVASVDELVETVAVFHASRLPRGGRVAAVCLSGGAGGLLSDLAADNGLSFPSLPQAAADTLRDVIPPYGTVGNPLDVTSQAVFETDILRQSLNVLAETGGSDVIVYVRSFPSPLDRAMATTQIIERAIEEHPDVLFLALAMVGGHRYPSQYPNAPAVEPIDRLDGVPLLQGAEYGLRAIAALVRYAELQRARDARVADGRRTTDEVARRARVMVQVRSAHFSAPRESAKSLTTSLTEREGKEILALYGIPTTREQLAASPDEALAVADEIGYPVALKVESPDLLHKTEAGAVALGVSDASELAEAFERVLANARRALAGAMLSGVLVQEMVGPGLEMMLGMKRDPQFGPVVACGAGGIFVELLKDVQLLLPPISEQEARATLERLRAFPLLEGVRGSQRCDLDALVDVLLRFSELCLDLQDLVEEIDVNPLIVLESGRGARAVDCLIVPRSAD